MRTLRLITLALALAPVFPAAQAALSDERINDFAAPVGSLADSMGAVGAVALPAPLTRSLFLGELARALSSHFNLDGDLQLDLLRTWNPPARVAALWRVEITEYPSLPSSSMLIRCQILAEGEVVDQTQLILRAQLWRDAWVTRQPLTVSAVFDPAQLDTRRVDLFRDREALPANVGDRSYIFARAIGPGRLLTWHDIARRPLVKKGTIVEVSASDGPLVITMKGLALENGAEGDTVTIRNPESRKDFAAMVVDENRVQVRF